jgi:hypothetical protein
MATFTLAESPALQRAAIPRSSSGLSSRDWDEFASALLEEGLTLTALELYTELLESGKDLQCLKDYFSNPGNFEHTLPQTTSALGYLQGMGKLLGYLTMIYSSPGQDNHARCHINILTAHLHDCGA